MLVDPYQILLDLARTYSFLMFDAADWFLSYWVEQWQQPSLLIFRDDFHLGARWETYFLRCHTRCRLQITWGWAYWAARRWPCVETWLPRIIYNCSWVFIKDYPFQFSCCTCGIIFIYWSNSNYVQVLLTGRRHCIYSSYCIIVQETKVLTWKFF